MSAALMTGNPVNGFTFIGPFDDTDGAIEYAERHTWDGDWWIIDLQLPQGTRWVVIDNVTGAVYSRPYDTEESANRVCAALNMEAGPGGRYGVKAVAP